MGKVQLHVGIVGAGLGGLAAAISIARAGHRVTILEQATRLDEVSASLPDQSSFYHSQECSAPLNIVTKSSIRLGLAFKYHPTVHGF
jgi:cation diffusion facilitator CzcD-associated flavoprotein CzcO